MIKTLVVGAALGVMGKKLYDQGKLDPWIDRAREGMANLTPERQSDASRTTSAARATSVEAEPLRT